MRLLVSVRSESEVAAAVAGGTDIVDAKEPRVGALGAVSAETFRRIAEQVPAQLALSAALGDAMDAAEVYSTIAGFPGISRPGPLYLKLGFAGVSDVRSIGELLEAACRAARDSSHPRPAIVAVAYGDWERAASASPELVCSAAAGAGAAGLLLDTHLKGERHLLDWIDPERLKTLVRAIRNAGLLAALAGGLRADHLAQIGWCEPDIVGFRGAVCTGGRNGRVSSRKVAHLRQALDTAPVLVRGE